MMARARDGFDHGDRERELRDQGATAKAASLAGWLIVAALLLTLIVAG
jgi:hypothetical protein